MDTKDFHPITGREPLADLSEPTAALVQFYRAFNTRDLALMAENWDRDGDIVMDNPVGGIANGWDDIKRVYERLFNGHARIEVAFHDYKLKNFGALFLAIGRERGKLVRGETNFDLAFRTTRLFRFNGGRWRQIHHHGSIDEPTLLARFQLALS